MSRKITCFDANWKFMLGDYPDACLPDYNDAEWRELDLPHDWSIEGRFERINPTGGSGAPPPPPPPPPPPKVFTCWDRMVS